jgi:hypothetical protein
MADRLFTDPALQSAYRALMRESSDGHLDELTWEAMAAGALDDERRAAAFDHVTVCGRCAGIWRELLSLQADAQAQGLIPPVMTPRQTRWIRSPLVGLAIAASMAVVIGVVVMRPPQKPAPAGTQSAPAPPVPAGSGAASAAFAVTKAEIHVLPEDALSPRGAEPKVEPAVEQLAEALAPYRRDEYAAAAGQLAALSARFPQSGRTALYLGVSLLMLDRPAEALSPLQTASAAPQARIAADGRWYHAVALARSGRLEEARRQASELCAAGGANAERACAAARDQSR